MKSFAEFITESAAPLTVAQFPILASTAPGVKRLDRIIVAINKAIADNAIPNARFLRTYCRGPTMPMWISSSQITRRAS
jgi:hypothetical protein